MLGGFLGQIVLGALGLVVIVLVMKRGSAAAGTGSPLVLKSFEVKADGEPAVLIEGRSPGLLAWLLTSMGLDATTVLIVTNEQIRIKKSGLSGNYHSVVPTTAVSSTHCGYSQPIWLLLLAAAVLLLALYTSLKAHMQAYVLGTVMLPTLVLSIVLALIYVYQRKIEISIETSGGMVIGIAFRPSFVEGVHINLAEALRVIARINSIVVDRSEFGT